MSEEDHTVAKVPWWMVVNAVRYALGRQTYVVAVTCEWVCAHWGDLGSRAQGIITTDVERAFRQADATPPLGMLPLGSPTIDRPCWEHVRTLWRGDAT